MTNTTTRLAHFKERSDTCPGQSRTKAPCSGSTNCGSWRGFPASFDRSERHGIDESRCSIGLGFESISIRSDSQLLVRQLEGAYRVKNEKLKALFSKALRKLGTNAATDIKHIVRADNKLADKLVNRALNLKADCDGDM